MAKSIKLSFLKMAMTQRKRTIQIIELYIKNFFITLLLNNLVKKLDYAIA